MPGPIPGLLTVSMSRNRLFLGGLLSSRARLRFTGWPDCYPPASGCKPARILTPQCVKDVRRQTVKNVLALDSEGPGHPQIQGWEGHRDQGHPPPKEIVRLKGFGRLMKEHEGKLRFENFDK